MLVRGQRKATLINFLRDATLAKPFKMASPFHFNYAIICRIPESFATRAIGAQGKNINLDRARAEYDTVREVLKNCDVNLIELQEDENYPDCCFVEDTAVVIGGVALITRPGDKSRLGEVSRQLLDTSFYHLQSKFERFSMKMALKIDRKVAFPGSSVAKKLSNWVSHQCDKRVGVHCN